MFFWLSKLFWWLFQPLNLVFLLLLAALLLSLSGHGGWARALLALVVGSFLAIAVLPVNALLLMPLEQRFPRPAPLPDRVDGVIMLGGAQEPRLTAAHGVPALNDAAERMVAFAALARRYPRARLVFTGGSGDPLRQDLTEAQTVRLFAAELGIDPSRIVLEARSRNTWENALYTRELVAPQPGERWLLVTSARHMPRAVGVFRQVDWPVIAYPCDYRGPATLSFDPRPEFLDAFGQSPSACANGSACWSIALPDESRRCCPAPDLHEPPWLQEVVICSGTVNPSPARPACAAVPRATNAA